MTLVVRNRFRSSLCMHGMPNKTPRCTYRGTRSRKFLIGIMMMRVVALQKLREASHLFQTRQQLEVRDILPQNMSISHRKTQLPYPCLTHISPIGLSWNQEAASTRISLWANAKA